MKLTPMKFLPDVAQMPWGTVEYKIADLGFVDSMASEGSLKGNTLSDIMQTYLEQVVGETSFEWYGTQFPVLVKRLHVNGRTSLHVNPDDESSEQRYDAFGKTALWYVESAGPGARLYLGFKRPVSAEEFFNACQEGRLEKLLHSVRPEPGDAYLITPGLVHAAQDVTLTEVAESSELWFRLHDWDRKDREIHLEEAFDLIDFKGKASKAPSQDCLAATPQFTVHRIALTEALKSHRDTEDTFLIYVCISGEMVVSSGEQTFGAKAGEVILIPSDVTDFFLAPSRKDTVLLEVRMDPRQEDDLVSEPVDDGSEN
ncbi:MAG: class I mannose-6-phosphate isomerase [Bacteroidales bacterium]|nr:class I mannose-6-phosphate isomerase [Bacteroidales bacterium]